MLPLLAVATMLSSCLQEETAFQEFEYIDAVPEIPVEVDGFAGTRSVVNETSSGIEMLWGTSESIGVYGSNLTNAKFVGTNKYYEQASTSFKGGSLLSSPKYAYYPYSQENASNSMNKVRGQIPQIQYFSTVHKKMNTDYKIGVYASRTLTSYKFTFSHILTFLRFIVNADGTALQGDKLERITLTITDANGNPRQVNGKFTFDLTKPSTQAITSWDAPQNGSNSLTLAWSDTPTLKAGSTYTAYLSAAPTSVPGDILHWEIRTDKHIATFTRTSKATFKTNGLIKYTLTLANFADMVVEEVKHEVPGETPDDDVIAGLTGATPKLNSFSFTVEDNPGKILARKFSHNSSFSVTTSTVTKEDCAIDHDKNIVTLSLPYLNDRKLVPTFEVPEGTALINDRGEVIVSGETEIDFVNTKQLAVVNANDELAIYDFVLTNTGLPVVVVNQATGVTSTESDDEYEKASNAWYKATGTKWQPKESDWEMTEGIDNFMIYNADGTPALADKNGAIVEAPVLASTRVRGNVTQQMPKKPFAVKLDKKHAITITNADGTKSVMPAHKRWVLLANWKDRTLMRNAVAFGIADVFKQTFPNDGMAWNPSGEFVELVYNGVHVGTYYLCEQIKIDGNRLDINEPLDEKDNPYNGDPSVFGYLLESDDAYDETWKFTTACYVPFLFKDDGNSEMLTYAQNFVRGIEDNLYKNTTAGYEAAYANMDLTSFVDFWLIQELMMNSETKHPKSCHSYINNGKMYAGPIWDFDWNTLPTSSSYSEEGYSYTTSMLSKAKASHKSSGYPTEPIVGGGWLSSEDKNYLWYPMLVKDATFKNLAAERWNAVKGAIQTYVNTEIPKIEAKIAASEAINNAMWPVDSGSGSIGTKRYSTYGIGGGFCGDEGKSFSDAVDAMQSTLTSRINGMSFVSNKSWPTVSYSRK